MSSVASTSAPTATNANSKAENRRETRAMRSSAAVNSSAGQVSRVSSSSARASKRRLKQQQQQQGPTNRSSRRRKLSSTSNSSSSDAIGEGESDDEKDCGRVVAVESGPDNVSSTTAFVKKEIRPSMQTGSTKIGTYSCTSPSHSTESVDCGLMNPWKMRRKRKLQTEPTAITEQGDKRSDQRDSASNREEEDRKSESISLNDFKVSTNAIHNPSLDETNIEFCKSVNTSSSHPLDKAKTSPIETPSLFNDDNGNHYVSDHKEIHTEKLIEKVQGNSKTLTYNEYDAAEEVNVNICSSAANVDTQSARDTEEISSSLMIDDQIKVCASSEEHETLQDKKKKDDKEAIGSPAMNDTIVNQREGCLHNFHNVDVGKEISIKISDVDAVGVIDPDHFSEQQPKLSSSTEELDQRMILHQSNSLSPSVENTVDNLVMEPSEKQQLETAVADPGDAEESCSKINGCTFRKIATPDASFIDENLTIAEQFPASLSHEILHARPHAESCNSSRNSLTTGEKPVSPCIDGESSAANDAMHLTATAAAATYRRSMTRVGTNGKFDLVDSIKLAIHAEASQVHRGKGANKLFSEYLERLAVYLSNPTSFRSRRRTASINSINCSANISASVDRGSSIESFFNNFLKTKRLRHMHNELIMVLMKYSMESQVPCDSFCSHIPHQWLHNVTEASLSTVDEDAFTSEPVGMKINQQRAELMNQIHYLKSYFSVESGLWAQNDTSNILYPPPLCTHHAITAKPEHDDSSILPSGNIPGALTIDPLVRNIAQREGISVDEYALWLIIIATRQFALETLQRAVTETIHSGRTGSDAVLESSNGDSKLRNISTQDFALFAAKSRTIYGDKFSIHTSSSRVFMDRLLNAAGRRMFPCPPEAPAGVQQAILQLIQAASCMRSKTLSAHTAQVPGTESFRVIDEQSEASSALTCGRRRGMLDSSLLSLTNKKEKSVGEPEHDSNSQQLLSPASINSTSDEPEMLQQVQEKDDKPKPHEEKCGSEKLPVPTASDVPRKRAGGKDLAALRARRMAATQPEQPSQENAVVANVDVATATKYVD